MARYSSILLVDDDDISNFLAEKIIRRIQLSNIIYTARHGREALTFLRNVCKENDNYPEIILLDIKMPVMNGFEFLEEFFATNEFPKEKIAIILLTSSADPLDVEESKRYNINGYINKPLTPQKLTETLILNRGLTGTADFH